MENVDYDELDLSILECNVHLNSEHPENVPQVVMPGTLDLLKSVGWEEGQKIPGGLSKYLSAVLEILGLSATKKNIKLVMSNKTVQHSLRTKLQNMRDLQNIDNIARQAASDITNIDPSNMTDAQEEIFNVAMSKVLQDTHKDLTSIDIKPVTPDKKAVSEEQSTEPEQEESSKESVDVLSHHYCPCCHWNLDKEYPEDAITESDEKAYLAYILGGSTFYKTYSIWNDAARVTYHVLTTEEEEQIQDQITRDYHSGKCNLVYQMHALESKYKTALSVDSVVFTQGSITSPRLPRWNSSIIQPEEGQTRIEAFYTQGFCKTFPAKTLQDQLITKWRVFQNQLTLLEHRLFSKDFWEGLTMQ
ncbi:MAG: hypothetical protein Q4D38_00140 [Planctomycetia bacterium]|nr:hypothetical protein [Planctomycetia bacterium]